MTIDFQKTIQKIPGRFGQATLMVSSYHIQADILKTLAKLCQENGFVSQVGSRIFGKQQKIHYRFGHAGTLLRRNIEHGWWESMVTSQPHTYSIEDQLLTSSCYDDNDDSVAENISSPSTRKPSQAGLSCYLWVLETNNERLPFSIAQVTPYLDVQNTATQDAAVQNFLFNSAMQTGLYLQHFCAPSDSNQVFDHLQRTRVNWWRQYSQIPSNFSGTDMQTDPEGTSTAHIQYELGNGEKVTIETIRNYGDSLIRGLEAASDLSHQARAARKLVIPAVIECETSIERAMACFLLDSLIEKLPEETSTKTAKQARILLRLHNRLAPYKVAIAINSTGSKGRELRDVADLAIRELRHAGMSVFDLPDVASSLGSKYSKFDQLGIPFSVILRDKSAEDGIVGLRARNTTLEEQIHITELRRVLQTNIRVI